ncbi:hypothetical protein HRbin36_01715 [bacterium HR36]|nr:hypothetical protein HRbin36_01715 [bacterium HR36]
MVAKPVGGFWNQEPPDAYSDLAAMPQKTRQPSAELHRLSLQELAERTQCTPRTIRFYIARGLLPGPVKAGRGAWYGEEHVRRIEAIRRWQRQGLTLAEIAARLTGNAPPAQLTPTTWWSYAIAPDVVVQVRAGIAPWRLHRILNGLRQLAQHLASEDISGPPAKESDDESTD